eukprot:CAMPEP_0201567572 /NCGR_PEP_ID=MMETSP0190_2-20130828/8120_1 /ASSEMBLY_ACC=CAM_ASM_000263 /TAXON_ID=37353 /ORGANISM="Rosalina sp." /LENGTH=184 /DNA_ID=CAMNT_0047987719 /DNA_START=30 /DNA_END=581 /DNA_ORIENTATION=-
MADNVVKSGAAGGSPTFKSNPNPGKLNTSFWNSAFKKEDDKPKGRDIPKKVSLYGKSFYADKDADADEPQEKPKEVIIGGDDDNNNDEDDNKDGMVQIRGKCIERNCKCERFVENPSKWSKGKCKTCDHPPIKHKLTWVKKEDVEENNNGASSASYTKPQSPTKPKAAEPEPAEPEPEELENLW